MAGIYIHIPFCKQACHYCDFHFSTSLKTKDDVLKAICKEVELQKNFLKNEEIESIYFGGGTPSILSADEINLITNQIAKFHNLSNLKEVTLEINPDDINSTKAKELKNTLINRFSVGIQSFFDNDLQYMNRAHNANEAQNSILLLQDTGFNNLTLDLIYGIPNSTLEKWAKNLQKAFDLKVPHLSCYSLTIEDDTVFGKWHEKGKINVLDDDAVNNQFLHLMDESEKNGYEHYEISNFAKEGNRAFHNTNYWLGKKYLGIGPSAHSYNGKERFANIANNVKYINAIVNNFDWFEREILAIDNQANEYIMTSLRTIWGCDLKFLQNQFNYNVETINEVLINLQTEKLILIKDNIITLTKKGKLLTDSISEKFII